MKPTLRKDNQEDAAARLATMHDSLGNRLTKVGQVLTVGDTGAFDSSLVESLCVGRDPITGKLAGLYAGYSGAVGTPGAGSIGLAYSDDGVYWTKYPTAILAPTGVGGDPDLGTCTGPVWLYENGTYYLFYIGASAAGYEQGTKRICLATATSLTGTWTRLGAIISPAGAGWRQTAVWHPSIVKHNGLYYMFFNASNGGNEQIGYATAPALRGPWTVDDTNSPLFPLGAGSSGEATKQGDPTVRRVGDLFVMDYFGYKGGFAGDYIATTKATAFPLGWTKWPSNPVLVPGASGSFDSLYAHKPAVYVERGKVFHYYTADDGTNRSVGLAVSAADPTVSTFNVRDTFTRANAASLGTATSGQVWTGATGWGISSNTAAWTGTVDGNALIDSGISDNFAIRFKALSVTGQYPLAVQFRYTNSGNYFKLYKNNTNWNLSQSGTVNGIGANATLANGDWVEVQVRGNHMLLLINEIPQAWAIMATTPAVSTHGIAGSGNLALTVDHFTIRPL